MLRMKISEMITDRYKLRIPPTVYYDLLADVQEAEEEQEPTTKNDLGVEHHKQNIQAYAHDFGVSEEQAEKELRVTTKNNLGVDCISRTSALDSINWAYNLSDAYQKINDLPSVTPQPCEDTVSRQAVLEMAKSYNTDGWDMYTPLVVDVEDIEELPPVISQEPILDKINKMKSEIADSLEFWDYSPSNNPLARDMLETLTNFWRDIREVEE